MPKKVLVGLSGGVDSAVTTALLQQQGYYVECAFMHNWHDQSNSQCQASHDYDVAVKVADHLKVNLHSLDFATEYYQEVFEPFIELLNKNLTPNPDILCNKNIKFKYLLDYALLHKFDYIATGHYSKIQQINNKYALLEAQDLNKDQSYFLHQLNQYQLSKTLFPLGNLVKKEVRKIAKELLLPNYNKKESMGICFIGQKNFQNFIEPYLINQPGDIITSKGEVIGAHKGLFFYTIGQRKGIGIGGNQNFKQKCWYVIKKDAVTNCLVVSQNSSDPDLYKKHLHCEAIHWINNEESNNLFARIRHRQQLQECNLNQDGTITFQTPQRAVSPGQFVVLYKNQQCLGGAMINYGFNS